MYNALYKACIEGNEGAPDSDWEAYCECATENMMEASS